MTTVYFQPKVKPTTTPAITVLGQQVCLCPCTHTHTHTHTNDSSINPPTQLAPPPPVVTVKDFLEDDLALELQDEYDPLVPNSYEQIYQERKVKQDKIREEEVC